MGFVRDNLPLQSVLSRDAEPGPDVALGDGARVGKDGAGVLGQPLVSGIEGVFSSSHLDAHQFRRQAAGSNQVGLYVETYNFG